MPLGALACGASANHIWVNRSKGSLPNNQVFVGVATRRLVTSREACFCPLNDCARDNCRATLITGGQPLPFVDHHAT